MTYKVFEDHLKLIDYAHKFIIEERLTSLQKDVKACLKEDCAFPALLYCFSTIDLMGTLYTGQASKGSPTPENFKIYMCEFMRNGAQNTSRNGYILEHANLILNIFRHKTGHLAQPKLVINYNNKLIAWRYEYPETLNHLNIENIGKKKQVKDILTPHTIEYDHVFVVSINQLMHDIVDSVIRYPDGYFAKLKGCNKMQEKFDDAIEQIYNPNVVKRK
jgi:hypothetical protein